MNDSPQSCGKRGPDLDLCLFKNPKSTICTACIALAAGGATKTRLQIVNAVPRLLQTT